MGRGGAPKDRSDGPERKCIASGEVRPKYGLIRFVIGPDAQVVPDIAGKLPGRGIYVSADRAAIEKAANKGLFARAAKSSVKAPDGLTDEVERQLARRVVELTVWSLLAASVLARDAIPMLLSTALLGHNFQNWRN